MKHKLTKKYYKNNAGIVRDKIRLYEESMSSFFITKTLSQRMAFQAGLIKPNRIKTLWKGFRQLSLSIENFSFTQYLSLSFWVETIWGGIAQYSSRWFHTETKLSLEFKKGLKVTKIWNYLLFTLVIFT